MNRGQIRRVERERVKDRRGEILASAWVGHPDVAPPPWRGDWLAHDAGAEVAGEPADVPVLVMVGSADSPVGALLLAHAQDGARVYVLAPTGWGIGDRALLGCPKVLIRSIDEVPASAVITGSGAHVWMAAPSGRLAGGGCGSTSPRPGRCAKSSFDCSGTTRRRRRGRAERGWSIAKQRSGRSTSRSSRRQRV